MTDSLRPRVFYGWWIVLAPFLNLFFAVGIVFYGFPVFYPSLVNSLHFSRQQATTGMFLGFAAVAPLYGLFVGALIDRLGARLRRAWLPRTRRKTHGRRRGCAPHDRCR
jgi:MFS family permease